MVHSAQDRRPILQVPLDRDLFQDAIKIVLLVHMANFVQQVVAGQALGVPLVGAALRCWLGRLRVDRLHRVVLYYTLRRLHRHWGLQS